MAEKENHEFMTSNAQGLKKASGGHFSPSVRKPAYQGYPNTYKKYLSNYLELIKKILLPSYQFS